MTLRHQARVDGIVAACELGTVGAKTEAKVEAAVTATCDLYEPLLRDGVKLLRTTYGSKAAFADSANEWVRRVERLLDEY